MKAAIKGGEIAAATACSGKVIERDELAAQALQLWPVEPIEQALGAQAARVLPESVRTRPLRARLPRYQLAMLEYVAEKQHTTVSSLLALAVDDFATDHADELSSIIPGLAEALFWDAEASDRKAHLPGPNSPVGPVWIGSLQTALRNPRNACAVRGRQDDVARLHSSDELGCHGAGQVGDAGHDRGAGKMMKKVFALLVIAAIGLLAPDRISPRPRRRWARRNR
jgi:hypothetical protein